MRNYTVALFLAVGSWLFNSQPASAEPLTPLNPAELQYLEQLHRVFSVARDPIAFRGDGELLARGRLACRFHDIGLDGQAATYQVPAITQLALIYLCPQ